MRENIFRKLPVTLCGFHLAVPVYMLPEPLLNQLGERLRFGRDEYSRAALLIQVLKLCSFLTFGIALAFESTLPDSDWFAARIPADRDLVTPDGRPGR